MLLLRRGAGFDTNQARRQRLEEGQDVAPLQLTAEDYLATGINAVHLKYRLGNVRPIVVTACMGSSSESWERSTAPTSMALTCRVEEPFTASKADFPVHL